MQSEQDEQQYVERLRVTPVEQLVSELMITLLRTAQVKLGRRDARLLIDLAGVMTDHAREHVSAEFGKRVDDSLAQLRFAQVTAEREAAQNPEPNDLATLPTPPAAAPAPSAPPTPPATSKLWIPGR